MSMIRYSSVWVLESPDGAIRKERVDNYVLMNLKERGGGSMRVIIWAVLLVAALSTGILLVERDQGEPRIQPVPVQSDAPGAVVR